MRGLIDPRGLSPEQRDHAINTFLGFAYGTFCVVLTVWVMASIVVGSIALGRWIGDIG